MSDSIAIIHKLSDFYQLIYQNGKQINKRDRFGIQQNMEKLCLISLELAIEAAYSTKIQKQEPLKKLRIKIEILKNLTRLSKEMRIINDNKYIQFEQKLIEISKMANLWLNWSIGKEDSK